VHTTGREISAALSSTADWIVYLSNETGRDEAYARDVAGAVGRVRLSSDGAADPSWSLDGREVYFRTLNGDFFVVPVRGQGATLQFGVTTHLFSAPLPFTFAGRTYLATADRRFLVNVLADDVAARSSIVVMNWLEHQQRASQSK
jgi:hypothetical protein